jgi:hypothetical protein
MMQNTAPAAPEMRYLAPGAKLGKGPYTTVECQPGQALVAELAKLVNQLRDAATEGNWSLDWSKFNAFSRQAETEATQGNHSHAVRDYARALRAMMNELRNQRQRRDRKNSGEEDSESVLGR